MSSGTERVVEILSQDKIVAYCLSINPEPWAVGTISIGRNKETGKLIPVVSADKTLQMYQHAVKSELERQGATMKLPAYALRFTFSRQLVKYTKLAGGTATRSWADVTNMQKATEDAIQGVLIGNDREVWDIHSRLAGTQDPNTKPWVLIELKYAVSGYSLSDLSLPTGMSDAGLEAMTQMFQEELNDSHIQDNDWNPDE